MSKDGYISEYNNDNTLKQDENCDWLFIIFNFYLLKKLEEEKNFNTLWDSFANNSKSCESGFWD